MIATAVRTVKEQTGVDLTPCSKWINVGTFVYNRNDSLGDDREYSVVFLPDIWSLLDPTRVNDVNEGMKDISVKNESVSKNDLKQEKEMLSEQQNQPENNEDKKEPLDVSTELASNNDSSSSHVLSFPTICVPSSSEGVPSSADEPTVTVTSEKQRLLDHINELKVTELKSQLDERDVKYKSSAKKAELVSMLTDVLQLEIDSLRMDAQSSDTTAATDSTTENGLTSTTPPADFSPDTDATPSIGICASDPSGNSVPPPSDPDEAGSGEKLASKRRHESTETDDAVPAKKPSQQSCGSFRVMS